MLRIITSSLLFVTVLAGAAFSQSEGANIIDRVTAHARDSPQSLIPTIFSADEAAVDVEAQLIRAGYRLTETRKVIILLAAHVPLYRDGGMFNFEALGANGPTAPGQILQFDKYGRCRDLQVRVGITDDGKLQFARAASIPICVL